MYYSVLGCRAFINAVENLLIPYKKQGLDNFKRDFSVSGIAKLQIKKHIKKIRFSVFFQNGMQICTKLCIVELLVTLV